MKKKLIFKSPLYLFMLFGLFFLNSCEKDNAPLEQPVYSDQVNFQVAYDQAFENSVYPSLILGLSNYSARNGESFELFKYSMVNPAEHTEVKVNLSPSLINNESAFHAHLDTVDKERAFFPMINWNYENLKSLKQPGTVDLSFACYINGEETDDKSLRLNYRSVNECVYGFIDNDGNYIDFGWMFAAYVNENNPSIDNFLQEVLYHHVVDAFIGYQGSKEEVMNQVFAIWNTLQLRNVKYSSITATSNPSQKVLSQYVRSFDEVYQNSQANCVDGSVFLASVLMKIDIKPFLVLIPGHMYLGFYTSEDKTDFELLETTMVGSINLNEIYEANGQVYNLNKYLGYVSLDTYNRYLNGYATLENLKMEISYNSFLKAINQNISSWNYNRSAFNNPDNVEYQIFDISELRKVVQPIGI